MAHGFEAEEGSPRRRINMEERRFRCHSHGADLIDNDRLAIKLDEGKIEGPVGKGGRSAGAER